MRRVVYVQVFFLVSLFVFVLYPGVVQATGFAKQSLFLSQSSVTEGQTVFIYAVVEDSTPNAFVGTLRFSDENGLIKEIPVSLESGKASTVSVPWQPKAGTHTVTATLATTAGTAVESQDATFTINAPHPTASTPVQPSTTKNTERVSFSDQTIVSSSTPVINLIGRFLPQAAAKSQPVFTSIDTLRTNSVAKLDQGTTWSKANMQQSAATPGSTQNTLWLILNTFVLYLCSSVAYALAHVGIFYPALVGIFFFILWRIFKLFKR